MRVSVICGVYNEVGTFQRHLQSLVDQTHKGKEIIIVDDGSTDGSDAIGQSFAQKYASVKFFKIKHKDGYGCVRPRMEAITHATGDVFCMVDADAYYDKNYLKYGVETLYSEKTIGAVVPRMHFWDPQTFIAKYKSLLYELKFERKGVIEQEIREAKHSPWIVKRSVYKKVGGYHIKDAYCEDVELAKRILKAGFRMVHDGRCHWHHKLEERFADVVRKNFTIGRMYASERNARCFTLKRVYFLLPVLIVLGSILFGWNVLGLLVLHAIPLIVNAARVFVQAEGLQGRWYAWYGLLVSYVVNVPNVLGVIYGLARPYRK